MAALREIIARFGVSFDNRQLQRGERSIASATTALRNLAGVIAGSAVVIGIKNFVNEIREAGDELDKTSQQLGITTGELQSFRHAAGLSGASAEDASNSLRFLQKNLQDAATGGSTTSEMFDIMGISAKTADGAVRSVNDVLPEVAEHFRTNTNASEKTAIAMTLFGRSGSKLIPLLNSGAASIADMRAELEELGGGLSEDAVQASVELTDTLARLDLAFLSFKSRIATAVLPILESLAQFLGRASVALSKALEGTNLLQATLIVLGGAGAAAVLKLVGGFRVLLGVINKLILRILLPILLVDELITTFQGGDTIIRRVIDGIFGEGQTKRIVDAIKSIGEGFSTMIDDMQNDRQAFEENMRRTSQSIEKDFGGAAAFIFEAMANALDLIVASGDEKASRLGQRWEELKAIFAAVAEFMAAKFSNAATHVGNAFTGVWNNIIQGAQNLVQSVGGLLSNIPGLDNPFESALKGLENLKGQIGSLDQRDFAAFVRANDQSVPIVGGPSASTTNNQTSNRIDQNIRFEVNVPPGTTAEQVRHLGRAASSRLGPSTRAALNALTPAG